MNYMKKTCGKCPYRKDVKPFLTPQRGEELALHALRRYGSFSCHRTTEDDIDNEGNSIKKETDKSKECAGYLTLKIAELGSEFIPEGFVPSETVYEDVMQMIDSYKNAE
jgi:hypothetical protein